MTTTAQTLPAATHGQEPADQARALGLAVGDTILGREQSGGYWSEVKLTLLWLGKEACVWREVSRDREHQNWDDRGEVSDWTLDARPWQLIGSHPHPDRYTLIAAAGLLAGHGHKDSSAAVLRAADAVAPDAETQRPKDHEIAALVNKLCRIAVEFHDQQQLRERVAHELVPMLKSLHPPFQPRVRPWLLACFGEMVAGDREERVHRFLEEALELAQSCGCTEHDAHQLVAYVYGRPVGVDFQEVGGVMLTLAALCLARDLDMDTAGRAELARVSVPATMEKIRAKQAAKPKYSPLPGPSVQSVQGEAQS